MDDQNLNNGLRSKQNGSRDSSDSDEKDRKLHAVWHLGRYIMPATLDVQFCLEEWDLLFDGPN